MENKVGFNTCDKKPLFLEYYKTLFGFELKIDGLEPLTEEEIDHYLKTFELPVKKLKRKKHG